MCRDDEIAESKCFPTKLILGHDCELSGWPLSRLVERLYSEGVLFALGQLTYGVGGLLALFDLLPFVLPFAQLQNICSNIASTITNGLLPGKSD